MLALNRILHPTDYTLASDIALAHAVKIAFSSGSTIDLLHVAEHEKDFTVSQFPSINEILTRWKLHHIDSETPAESGFSVNKVVTQQITPVKGILHFLDRHPTDLIILATHGQAAWNHRSIAEPVARKSHTMTLFIRHGDDGFISFNDGGTNIKNIVLPIDSEPAPQLAIEAALLLADTLDLKHVNFELIHVGKENAIPYVTLPERLGCKWTHNVRHGSVVDEIAKFSNDIDADLAILTTRGHHGFLDALRGSITERVLHTINCPVLSVPA